MPKKINRREFIQKSAAIGVTSVLGRPLGSNTKLKEQNIDMVVVKGKDYFKSAIKAVETLGGMKKFVPKNSKVALLPNVQSRHPGTYTKPKIVRAAIQMCKEAGAKEIDCIGWLPQRNWQNTGMKKIIDEEGAQLIITNQRDETLFKPVPISKGELLKEARIMKTFYDYDVFINMNIIKEHSGSNLSGALKNLMGINSPKSNLNFHKMIGTTNKDDIRHLDRCIADLNTIIRPDLCIIDATEFVITNGPHGPGELLKPQKVIAGTDPVAIDSYGATLFGYKQRDILVLVKAHEHGIGEMDLEQLNIKELAI
ncbi:MAG: DUF362 domain-containing protein [Candidatus Aminicenantes bacterium]